MVFRHAPIPWKGSGKQQQHLRMLELEYVNSIKEMSNQFGLFQKKNKIKNNPTKFKELVVKKGSWSFNLFSIKKIKN